MCEPVRKVDYVIAVLKDERCERRLFERVKCFKRTRIVFGEHVQAMFCFLSDISDSGARLRPAAADRVPDRFIMQLEHDKNVVCKVVYRDEDALGVAFVQ